MSCTCSQRYKYFTSIVIIHRSSSKDDEDPNYVAQMFCVCVFLHSRNKVIFLKWLRSTQCQCQQHHSRIIPLASLASSLVLCSERKSLERPFETGNNQTLISLAGFISQTFISVSAEISQPVYLDAQDWTHLHDNLWGQELESIISETPMWLFCWCYHNPFSVVLTRSLFTIDIVTCLFLSRCCRLRRQTVVNSMQPVQP